MPIVKASPYPVNDPARSDAGDLGLARLDTAGSAVVGTHMVFAPASFAASCAPARPLSQGELLEALLARSAGDFSALYMAAGQGLALAQACASQARPALVDRLAAVLTDTRHGTQSQAYQLYLTAARAIARLLAGSPHPEVKHRCLAALRQAILTGSGLRLRAIARAVSVLPVGVPRAWQPVLAPRALPSSAFEALASEIGIADIRRCCWQGRSLVFPETGSGAGVVLKFAEAADGAHRLGIEAAWMRRLAAWRSPSRQRFEVPVPIRFRGSARVRTAVAGKRGVALLFRAPAGYFSYPAPGPRDPALSWAVFSELMVRNARLLGELMAEGISHDAPIPLFHNRVQGHRRDDAGRYLWDRQGRLDQWLDSCRYPNFGLSGLRDFEHFEPSGQTGAADYLRIGNHLLALVLVCGAYFRAKAPGRVGVDAGGRAVDTRHLFDRGAMAALVPSLAAAYTAGFAGCRLPVPHPGDTAPLVDRLIEEMGVDRHMAETLRVADQDAMSEPAFRRLLGARGVPAAAMRALVKGAADIRLMSGPHLGPFNGAISVPELTDFLSSCAALAILERFHRSGPPR